MDESFCYLCGGELVPLGTLGHRLHLNCRNCGMQFSRVLEPQEQEDDDDAAEEP